METQEVQKFFMKLISGNICHLSNLFTYAYEICNYCVFY